MTNDELACVYSALILEDGESPVTADKLRSLLESASVDVEPFWPGVFAKASESINIKELVTNIGAETGVSEPIASELSAPSATPAAEAKKEEKKEEEEEEDDDMGFGLFD